MKLALWGNPHKEFRNGPAEMERVFDRMKTVGVDIYIPCVTYPDIIYPSEILRGQRRDLLKALVESGKKAGIEIHAMIMPFWLLGQARGHDIEPDEYLRGRPGEGNAPDLDFSSLERTSCFSFQLKERSPSYRCPSHAEHVDVGVTVAKELCEGYGLAGIHLDFVRFPAYLAYCLCTQCKQDRMKWLGHEEPTGKDLASPSYQYLSIKERNRHVQRVVTAIREQANHAGVKLSIAARASFMEGGGVYEGQNWPEWCREGLLDFVCPMSYTLDDNRFAMLVERNRRLAGPDFPVYEGILVQRGSVDREEMSQEQLWRQIRYVLGHRGHGVAICSLGELTDKDWSVLSKLHIS